MPPPRGGAGILGAIRGTQHACAGVMGPGSWVREVHGLLAAATAAELMDATLPVLGVDVMGGMACPRLAGMGFCFGRYCRRCELNRLRSKEAIN